MLVVLVDIHVHAEARAAFIEASQLNAAASRQEPGIARFDLLSDLSDPNHFQLLEAYRSLDAPAAHKQTAHYAAWRDTVEPMMARPRSSVKFDCLSPEDSSY